MTLEEIERRLLNGEKYMSATSVRVDNLERRVEKLEPTPGLEPVKTGPWWENHSPRCGVDFRGCAPECPKEQVEQALEDARKAARRDATDALRSAVWVVIQELSEWDDYIENFDIQEWVDKLTRAVRP